MKQNILALDWSNLAFRSLYLANGFGSVCSYNTDEEINNFIGKIATDIAYILRMFSPNKVVFCADSKHSWRKDVISTYKSNRERSNDLNWEKIFGALDIFKNHLEKLGYIFAECENAEADDMLAIVKEIVFKDSRFANFNLILVSSDADIRQLIDFIPESRQYCMVFNEIGKGKGGLRHLYCNNAIYEWYNGSIESQINDIFNFGMDTDKEYIKSILTSNPKIKIESTDPENILLSKIFCGDDGDCVPSFYEWFSDKGSKKRITNAPFVKIKTLLEINNVNDLEDCKFSLKEAMEKIIKREINDIDVLKRLERQRKLVELNSSLFPDRIAQYKTDLSTKIYNQQPLNLYGLKMDNLLEGLEEFKEILVKDKKKDADYFKSLNKYVDNLKLTPLF